MHHVTPPSHEYWLLAQLQNQKLIASYSSNVEKDGSLNRKSTGSEAFGSVLKNLIFDVISTDPDEPLQP